MGSVGMGIDKEIFKWIKKSPKKRAVLMAIKHDGMTSRDILKLARQYDNTITQDEVEEILEEFISKKLIKP